VGASACGEDESKRTSADTEGIFLEIGGLAYQVQISRQLNPASREDRSYLVGLPQSSLNLTPEQTFFAVFLKATNDGDEAKLAASNFEIIDTLENAYKPIPPGPANVFAWRPAMVQPKDTLPPIDSTAYQAPAGGAVILFKLPLLSFDDRPLILRVQDPEDPKVIKEFTLDV
jgi:hypothetical protein